MEKREKVRSKEIRLTDFENEYIKAKVGAVNSDVPNSIYVDFKLILSYPKRVPTYTQKESDRFTDEFKNGVVGFLKDSTLFNEYFNINRLITLVELSSYQLSKNIPTSINFDLTLYQKDLDNLIPFKNLLPVVKSLINELGRIDLLVNHKVFTYHNSTGEAKEYMN